MKCQAKPHILCAIFLLVLVSIAHGSLAHNPLAQARSPIPQQPLLTLTSTARNVGSDKCLSGLVNEIEYVSQYDCTGGNDQKWIFIAKDPYAFMIINAQNGKCLDVAGGSNANGANVIQAFCNNSFSQWWQSTPIDQYYIQFKDISSSKCLDIVNELSDAGATVVQAPCNHSNYQKWSIVSSNSYAW